jgi:hypothetical protein
MIRGVCVASCLLSFVLGDPTIARADTSRSERRTAADSPFLLSRALNDHEFPLAQLASAKGASAVGSHFGFDADTACKMRVEEKRPDHGGCLRGCRRRGVWCVGGQGSIRRCG